MSTAQAKSVVKKYADVLKKNNFSFVNLYLFGSYALGKQKRDSDIDVAVVVKKIDEDYLKQKMNLWKFTIKVDTRIEPIILEEEELEENNFSIMGEEVRRMGILVE